jgi:GH15 family glucan-1,4-alpha-glucosidase
MAPKLSDYALIGNCRSAALVGNNGAIEWCCLPEFHSPSIFAALLDREKGGAFSIAPAGTFRSAQSYLPDTNVVVTHFTTDSGEARLMDAFVALAEKDKTRSLFPDHEILRVVEGVYGTVTLRLEYAPTLYYGKETPRLKDHKKLGIHFSRKENTYVLLSTLPPGGIRILSDSPHKAIAEFTIHPGERVLFSLGCSSQSPAILPELESTGWERMLQTIAFWQSWIAKCHYEGLYQQAVRRSALTLKLLAHAPSGAIIAAPTTSLPEEIGGERNWDYRYCWLRDASFTVRALVKLGFEEEAHAYMNWILHATQLSRPRLQVVYSVFGRARLKEERLSWLSGYEGSRPVRIGNGADAQFQLDVYGEVLDAVYSYAPLVEAFNHDSRKFILGLGDVICRQWDVPDNGIWEVRSSSVPHTHSKVMAWVGLDRLIKLCGMYGWQHAPIERYKQTARLIREQVEGSGYNKALQSYTRELNGDTLDASLLTLSLVDYCDATSPRMAGTIQAIRQQLTRNNLVYRYRSVNDGVSGGEGSFGICSFWFAENLARSGRLEEAKEVFEAVLQHAGPCGLLSEEIDPESGQLLGNYPQSFTHVGLINAALTFTEIYQKKGSVHAS